MTGDTNEIQMVIREYFKKLYSNKWENLEVDKSLDTYDLPKWSQEDTKNIKRTITSNEI
jgi:hypothetical protein